MRYIGIKVLKLIFLSTILVSCVSNERKLVPSTPQEALTVLLEGNKRYAEDVSIHPNCDIERVKETASHQKPFAAVVGCSDSRVPIELLFDQGIGDIFVIRTAGNNLSGKMVMGSIEYAVGHLGVKVLLVLGHGACGGVTSAVQGGEHHGSIGLLLQSIQQDIPEYIGRVELLDEAIMEHTYVQVDKILSNDLIKEKVANGELLVKAAYYDVNTGIVEVK